MGHYELTKYLHVINQDVAGGVPHGCSKNISRSKLCRVRILSPSSVITFV